MLYSQPKVPELQKKYTNEVNERPLIALRQFLITEFRTEIVEIVCCTLEKLLRVLVHLMLEETFICFVFEMKPFDVCSIKKCSNLTSEIPILLPLKSLFHNYK